ncbi:MAG: NADH-quinone oxidoreductase subunit NuoI [Caldilineales bacterium]|nr:NADH-quinone oxidoreductase subunit NuoI [Caldilineales bacterium]
MSGFKDVLDGAAEIAKAMGFTLKTLVSEPPVTVEYPDEPMTIYPRFRGRHELRRYENGLERCIGCCLCEAACPTGAIHVEAAENDPAHPTSPGERYASVYEVNLMRCIFCGDCEAACPTEAVVLGHTIDLAVYNRRDMLLTKEQLLNPPDPNTVIRGDW